MSKSIFYHMLVLGFIGFLIRLGFFISLYPQDLRIVENAFSIASAFWHGLRFDISAISYLTFLFVLLNISKKTSRWLFKTSRYLYEGFLYFWIALGVCDILFYSFYNDRINLIAFGVIDDDTTILLKTFWKNYPAIQIILAVSALCYVAKKSSRSFISGREKEIIATPYRFKFLMLAVLFGLGRGTVGLFPLGADQAVISSIPFLNHLAFGSGHALLRAAKLRTAQSSLGARSWRANLEEFGYAGREDQAFADYFDRSLEEIKKNSLIALRSETPAAGQDQISNVVLVVMESWGAYGFAHNEPGKFDLLGKMKSHLQFDFLNLHFLSNTPGTAGSLSCLLAGVPQRAISPFLTESSYLNTPLSTSPAQTYKQSGYETHFLYGGNPGWRDMNKYALIQGFDFVEGDQDVIDAMKRNNTPVVGTHDWGVHDEDLFKYLKLKLAERPQTKKLYVVMTTTNHPPFELPPDYLNPQIRSEINADHFAQKNILIDRTLAQKRFETFRYSSDQLGVLLTDVKNSALAENTVLAATADHNFWIINFKNEERFVKDAVPFYVYVPQKLRASMKLSADIFSGQFGGHMDIWPTLYNLSLSQKTFDSFGKNLFKAHALSFALNADRFIASADGAAYVHNGEKISSFRAAGQDHYEPIPDQSRATSLMGVKYRSLMGALDVYLKRSQTEKQAP